MGGNTAATATTKRKRAAPTKETPQPAKQRKIDFCDQITVDFASDVFRIPSVLLRSRSKFAARETKHGVLQVPNKSSLTVEIFSTYLQLLYTGEIVLDEPYDWMTEFTAHRRLTELYCLCEQLQDPMSMNPTMTKLVGMPVHGVCSVIKEIFVRRVYELSEAGSMLRKFVLDCAASCWTISTLKSFPQDFKDELLLRLQAMRDDPGSIEAIRTELNFPLTSYSSTTACVNRGFTRNGGERLCDHQQ